MLCVPFTIEDSEIVVRAAKRGSESLATLSKMIVDGNADDMLIKSRVEARQIDLEYEHYAQEEFHAWQEACREEDEYYEEFGDDIDF